MKRTLSIPAVVLVAVVALVLGTFGSATAAGITKGTVKKIAAKVVDKKASSLSVAKAATATKADTATSATTATSAATAATATTATNLGGKTAAQLQTNAIRYVLPVQAPDTTRDYTFPGLTPGTYLVSYSLTATMATAGEAPICQMHSTPTSASQATSYGGTFNGFARTESSGIVVVTATTELECNSSGGNFTLISSPASTLSEVNFIAVDSLTSAGNATGTRTAGAKGGPDSGN